MPLNIYNNKYFHLKDSQGLFQATCDSQTRCVLTEATSPYLCKIHQAPGTQSSFTNVCAEKHNRLVPGMLKELWLCVFWVYAPWRSRSWWSSDSKSMMDWEQVFQRSQEPLDLVRGQSMLNERHVESMSWVTALRTSGHYPGAAHEW